VIKGVRKIKLLSSIFFGLLLILVVFSRLTTSQVPPQEQDLEKENPLPIYLASAVFSFEDLLLVDAGFGIDFFNNTIKENPQYLGRHALDYHTTEHINVDDQLFSIGARYNETAQESYTYVAVHTIKENPSLELVRDYNLPKTFGEIIFSVNDSSFVLTVNNDRQSLSLFNCTETFEELPIQYNHESFFNSNDVIHVANYEDGYLSLSTHETDGNNHTLAIFDMINHTKLELLLSWSSDSSYYHYNDIAIEEERMYLISRYGFAKVLHVAENRTLEEIGVFDTDSTYSCMRIVSNYALLTIGSEFIICNITDLENVEQLGSCEVEEVQGGIETFFVIDELIYLSHYTSRTDNLLILLDWSNPINPFFIRTFGFPHTEPYPFPVVIVPVVFLVFTFGMKKRKMRKKSKQ